MKVCNIICLAAMPFIIALSGCVGWIQNEPYGRTVPKRPNWKLADGNPDPQGRIRYDAIYVADVTGMFQPEFEPYTARRFWPTGQQGSKRVTDYTDPDLMDEFDDMSIGYFKVTGDQIRIESYSRINFGQNAECRGHIEHNGDIVITEQGPQGGVWPLGTLSRTGPERYVPVPRPGMNLQPDW